MMAPTKKIILVLVLIVIFAVIAFLAVKQIKKPKTVAFTKEPIVIEPVPTVDVSELEEAPVEAPIMDVHIVPNVVAGISTRDGSVKDVDIRGTPKVTIYENAPVWNISPNKVPQEQYANQFFA